MDFLLNYFQSLFTAISFGLTIIDVVIIIIIFFYAYEGYVLGFLASFLDLVSFVLAFIIALKGYGLLGGWIHGQFGIPPGFSHAVAFFIIAFLSELILTILFRATISRPPVREGEGEGFIAQFKARNHFLGIIPGFLSAYIILAFLLTIVISLPTSTYLKKQISDSKIGSILVVNTSSFEKSLNSVFGGALNETLTFLTVKPESNETINLGFNVTSPTIDEAAETQMLSMVNHERVNAGLQALSMSQDLQILGRSYASDMFSRGYFSHYNPEGDSPFDRMEKANISFLHAGENLALAPSVELAMQGLMNSPGHRANILSPSFNKVGIGVLDGGIYGKMFTQEFTD